MTDLQKLKEAINNANFSDEAKTMIMAIIDNAISTGSLTPEQKQKLKDIMDVEIEANTVMQKVNEDTAEVIETFLAESDSAVQTAMDNLESLDKEVSNMATTSQ